MNAEDLTRNRDINSATPVKTAATATAREMLEIAGFKDRISERQSNHFEPHDSELANSQLEDRVDALFACLQRAKSS